MTSQEVDETNLKVETKDPTGKLIEPVDPVTGAKYPARLLMPDRGFEFNPGKVHWGGMADAAPGKWEDMKGLRTAADYGRRSLANIRPAGIPDMKEAPLPAGQADEFYLEEFMGRYGEETLLKDPLGEPVILSLRAYTDRGPKAKGAYKFHKPGHGESIPLVREMIESPLEIWLTPQQNTEGRVRLTKRYVSLWKTEGQQRIGGLVIFEVADGVLQGVSAFLPLEGGGLEPDIAYVDRQRRGLLLYPKGR